MILLEYPNIKTFLQKAMFQICLKKSLWLKKLKTIVISEKKHVISDLKGKETVGTFYEKALQWKNQKEFRVEKVIKGHKLSVKWNGYDSSFNSWIDKKRQYKWVNIFQNLQ